MVIMNNIWHGPYMQGRTARSRSKRRTRKTIQQANHSKRGHYCSSKPRQSKFSSSYGKIGTDDEPGQMMVLLGIEISIAHG